MSDQEENGRTLVEGNPERSASSARMIDSANSNLELFYRLTDDVGKLKGVIETLNSRISAHEKTLNWIKYIIFVTIGAFGVIFYLIDKRMDDILKFFVD